MISTAKNRSTKAQLAQDVVKRLDETYGRKTWQPYHRPLDELILTILSQHTSDRNSERAFATLRDVFPTWEAVRDAPVNAVADAIRCGGLADRKAPTIQAVLRRVLDEGTLDGIETLPLDEAKARLRTLPGVGPKTAACVLLFGCGRPALPVDTHVYRVASRVGLLDPGVSPEEAHRQLEALIDPDDVYSFHLNMIMLGREVCHARAPDVRHCPLADLCCRSEPGTTR